MHMYVTQIDNCSAFPSKWTEHPDVDLKDVLLIRWVTHHIGVGTRCTNHSRCSVHIKYP